jgi:hypothetical protein
MRTEKGTDDMTMIIVDFRNFANVHKNDGRVTLKQTCSTLLAKFRTCIKMTEG